MLAGGLAPLWNVLLREKLWPSTWPAQLAGAVGWVRTRQTGCPKGSWCHRWLWTPIQFVTTPHVFITLATSHNSMEGSVYHKSESLSHFRIFLHMGSYWYLHFPDWGTEAGIWMLPTQLLFMLVLLQCRGMPTTGSLVFAVNLGRWRMEWPSETSDDKRGCLGYGP